MKLAMRLPEKNSAASNDRDPREDATTEIIDLASRTSYPAVANRKGHSDALGLAAGIGFVALLGAATLWGLNASRMPDEAAQPAAPATVPPAQTAVATPPPDINALPSANAGAVQPDMQQGMAGPVLSQPPYADYAQQPQLNPYGSPVLVYDAGAAPGSQLVAAPTQATAPDGSVIAGSGSAGDFAARIGGIGGGPATAQQSFDPATTISQGTMIPAILETAINTDVPGYVRAVVSQDVRSFDGGRVLVPRSSRLVGQYQSGLQAGQRRAYVIWTTLIRPDGVSVNLASPATGFDGTTGLAGEVDSHFFDRFGSAMLLSVIGGLTTIASGGTSVILGGGQTAASTALQQDGQRPPTVRVRQGEPIRVFTSRHLDFSRAPRL
ncbi:type VI secretion protein [Altererythrobacter sp. KTW20L]|uniref:TrbI/VirB10 family protein n=1 Tax=Altererythrobacter sp. KTW20L TaxID=2942210 RepID=UPI0020C04457|nr:TrbI/VirB10 family protein [Altererythrobacter sp. KTW20L]MCL6250364.1 type VI secretion protein [Altererythrobacter sp. KTW20L]